MSKTEAVSSTGEATNAKYVVSKADTGETLTPGTYFVLRAQDVLSYTALWQYAQSLQTVIELHDSPAKLGSDHTVDALRPIVDYVESLAEQWQAQSRKFPD